MSPTLLTILTFGAVASGVAGVYSILADLYLSDRSRVSRRIDDEFRRRQRARAERSLVFKAPGRVAIDAAEDSPPDFRQRFATMVEQSGLDLTPRRLVVTAVGSALAAGVVGLIARPEPVTAAVAAALGGAAPLLYVRWKRKERLEKLLMQLPDAFDLMGRVIRSGQTMAQALQAVSDEFSEPIAGEFNYCYEQQNLGLPADVAMRELSARTGALEVKIFVLALLVQQQTGGNLAEMLDKLSGVIRDRQQVRGHIRALTAEGRLQAAILLGLPPAMFLMLLVINREYAGVLLQYPVLLGTTLACEALGALWIRKIVSFDF